MQWQVLACFFFDIGILELSKVYYKQERNKTKHPPPPLVIIPIWVYATKEYNAFHKNRCKSKGESNCKKIHSWEFLWTTSSFDISENQWTLCSSKKNKHCDQHDLGKAWKNYGIFDENGNRSCFGQHVGFYIWLVVPLSASKYYKDCNILFSLVFAFRHFFLTFFFFHASWWRDWKDKPY